MPVIVDAAPTQLPLENFRRWLDSAPICRLCRRQIYRRMPRRLPAGRRDLVGAATMQQQDAFIHPAMYERPLADKAALQEPPHQGIGRVLKVGREDWRA